MQDFLTSGVDLKKITQVNAGDAHFFDDSTTPTNVRQSLDHSDTAEKLKGMKSLLAMMSKGRDVAEFFPNVVKNVVAKSVEVKKMVYIYLVHFADFDDSCREISLLSINSFQKDLSGTNPLIRGLALRVMTSIRVSEIIQIQLLAVRKCATDSSPYVRKCAATALMKIYKFDSEQHDSLQPILEKLLNDSSTMVLGSAVVAFNEICPTDYSMLDAVYRHLCHLLADLDEWSQVVALDVLARYCRVNFTDPAPGMAAAARLQAKQRSASAAVGRIGQTVKRRVVRKAFYSDEEDESVEEEIEVEANSAENQLFTTAEPEGDMQSDHRLLLRSSLPLLKSRNSGVVMGVANLHYYCGSQNSATNEQIGKALVRILRNRREMQFVILQCISTLAQEIPSIFRSYLSDFFIKGSDPTFNRLLKLEILTAIFEEEDAEPLLRELQSYVKHGDPKFVSAAVRAVGRVVDVVPSVADKCLDGLMRLLLFNKSKAVMGGIVEVLRQILQQNRSSEESARVLNQLVKLLINGGIGMEQSIARASIVWLVGEFYDTLTSVAPDVLRILTLGFTNESVEVRMQILNFAIKLALRCPNDDIVQQLMQYVLELARYDTDTDLRDRSRFMTAMMGLTMGEDEAISAAVDEDALSEISEHAMGIMLAPKLPPVTLLGSVDVNGLPNFNLGSLSAVLGHTLPGYVKIPDWVSTATDSALRDKEKPVSSYFSGELFDKGKGPAAGAGSASEDPDDFYGDDDDDDDSGSVGSGESSDVDSSSDDSSDDSDDSSDGTTDDSSDSSSTDASSDESSSEESSSSSSDNSREASQRQYKAPLATGRRVVRNKISPQGAVKTEEGSLLGDNFEATSTAVNRAAAPSTSGGDNGSLLGDLSAVPSSIGREISTISSAFDDLLPSPTPTSAVANSPLDMSISEQLISFKVVTPESPSAMSRETANSILASATASSGDSVRYSPEKVLLKPEVCHGLSLSARFCFGRTTPPSLAFASMLKLRFENHSDQPIRRIRVNSSQQMNNLQPIEIIPPGGEVVVPVEIVLVDQGGKTVKLEVRSDKGSYTALLKPAVWEVLSPVHMSKEVFLQTRRLLGGFNEASKTFDAASLGLSATANDSRNVLDRINSRTDVFVVSAEDELMFAAVCRSGSTGEGHKALLTVTCLQDGRVNVKANCDDAVLSSQLLPILK